MAHKPQGASWKPPAITTFRLSTPLLRGPLHQPASHGRLLLSATRFLNCAKLRMASFAAIRIVQSFGTHPATCSKAAGRSAHLGSLTVAASLQPGVHRPSTALRAIAGAPPAAAEPFANGAAAAAVAPAVTAFPAPSPSQLVENGRAFVEAHRWERVVDSLYMPQRVQALQLERRLNLAAIAGAAPVLPPAPSPAAAS